LLLNHVAVMMDYAPIASGKANKLNERVKREVAPKGFRASAAAEVASLLPICKFSSVAERNHTMRQVGVIGSIPLTCTLTSPLTRAFSCLQFALYFNT
jgi:hypothetical protein